MFEPLILGLAAAAAIQLQMPVIRPIPVPAPVPGAPIIIQQDDAGKLAIALLPDLVVKEVRADGDDKLHVLVANQGTADARRSIRVVADAYIEARRGDGEMNYLSDLAMGEEKWVTIVRFMPRSEPYYVGKDYSFPLSKATGFSAHVDPPVFAGGGFLGGSDPSRSLEDLTGAKAPECYAERGCIRESDENNNRLVVEGDAIGRGKPE